MELKDFLVILGMIGTSLMALVGAAKYVISIFYEAQTKVQKVKNNYLSEKVQELKELTETFHKTLQAADKEISLAVQKIQSFGARLDDVVVSLEEYVRETKQNFKEQASEIKQISNDLYLLKRRK